MKTLYLFFLLSLLSLAQAGSVISLEHKNYLLLFNEKTYQLEIRRDNELIFQTQFSKNKKLNSFAIKPIGGQWQTVTKLITTSKQNNQIIIEMLTAKNIPLNINLKIDNDHFVLTLNTPVNCQEIRINSNIKKSGHWYGEGETVSRIGIIPILRGKMQQYWPLSNGQMKRKRFATTDHSSVLVPFWLTSRGVALFSDSYHYLHERFNIANNGIFSLGMIHNTKTRKVNKSFTLHFIVQENIVEVYKYWLHTDFTHKPAWNPNNPLPPFQMFEAPIWTTWAKYKNKVDQNKVLQFAKEIKKSKLPYKILEIDDRWQQNYGEIQFDHQKFPTPKKMIEQLKEAQFDITLWMPPFVNKKTAMFDQLEEENWLITNDNQEIHLTSWWDTLYTSKNSALFDFFNPNFRDYFSQQINDFTSFYNILGIKYDAGETVYLPDTSSKNHPNSYIDSYIKSWREIKAVEFRSATFSQHKAPIIREFDKNSTWDNYTGLKSVLTQALSIGIVGYPFVLPDMIGGNKYIFSDLSDELFIRWIQLNSFMPMVQLSLEPWTFNKKTQVLTAKYLNIHQQLVPYVWEQVKKSNQTGLPIIRPLFFEFPYDEISYQLNDQFLLGDRYLVAPILNKGQYKRHIYLPKGKWKDFWTNTPYLGPQWIKNYPAPLETIPVFERI